MHYCSLQNQTLLPSPVTSTSGHCFCFCSASSFLLELFLHSSPVAYWAPTNLGGRSSFSVISFCLFILFMGFSRQECWSGLPFPSPVDHDLSELSTMTHPSWVALHSMVHSFIELGKVWVHVIIWTEHQRLSMEELILSNCGAGEDSWESLGLQRDQTSQSWRKSALNIHWKDWSEAEAPILWPPDAKSWLIGKDPDAGKDSTQEEKGTTEDEMVGWHYRLNGREFEQAPRDGEGQGSLGKRDFHDLSLKCKLLRLQSLFYLTF